MEATLQDRQDISDLMTGWIYRDLGNWEMLRTLFHPDGEIEVTWFEGGASEFIEGSIKMGKSDLRTKHFVGNPVISFNADKAIVETNAMIIADNVALNIGCVAHNRFYDRVEKRDGLWKITGRQSVYDMSYFTFPCGVVEIESEALARYPREYAALAYLLEKSLFPVSREFATKGSELEKTTKAEGEAWLVRSVQ
jgi:hypothetical protein